MTQPPAIVTGILIGGKSQRMGTNKAALPWGDSTLLETIVQTVRCVAADCVLLGRMDDLPESLRDLPRFPDDVENVGPIAGLASLLRAYPDRWCFLVSCDVPRITPEIIDALADRASPGVKIVAYEEGSPADSDTPLIHATAALYHGSMIPEVDRAMEQKRYALHRLIHSVPHKLVPVTALERQALFNVNSPEDYDVC